MLAVSDNPQIGSLDRPTTAKNGSGTELLLGAALKGKQRILVAILPLMTIL